MKYTLTLLQQAFISFVSISIQQMVPYGYVIMGYVFRLLLRQLFKQLHNRVTSFVLDELGRNCCCLFLICSITILIGPALAPVISCGCNAMVAVPLAENDLNPSKHLDFLLNLGNQRPVGQSGLYIFLTVTMQLYALINRARGPYKEIFVLRF